MSKHILQYKEKKETAKEKCTYEPEPQSKVSLYTFTSFFPNFPIPHV